MARKWSVGRRKLAPEVEERISDKVRAFSVRQRDLSDVAGSWKDDPAFEAALAEQDTVLRTREGTGFAAPQKKPTTES